MPSYNRIRCTMYIICIFKLNLYTCYYDVHVYAHIYQDDGSDVEENVEDGEENPVTGETQPEETTGLLGPGHTHYIPQREWLNREAQVFHIPSAVPGTHIL